MYWESDSQNPHVGWKSPRVCHWVLGARGEGGLQGGIYDPGWEVSCTALTHPFVGHTRAHTASECEGAENWVNHVATRRVGQLLPQLGSRTALLGQKANLKSQQTEEAEGNNI